MLISNLFRRWIKYYSTTKPTQLRHYASTGVCVCVSPREAPRPSHRTFSRVIQAPLCRAMTAQLRPGQEVACVHLRFHSRIHSDTRCHLKPNSENRYDKLQLVLSLNCFSLEIDRGARAIHHSLSEVGAPRENGSASVWSRKKKKEKKRRKWNGC